MTMRTSVDEHMLDEQISVIIKCLKNYNSNRKTVKGIILRGKVYILYCSG